MSVVPHPLPFDVQGAGRRLVLVHGFAQTRACWGPFAAALADDHEVVRLDAPGHGDAAGVALDVATGAAAVVATGGRATYVGYSMGGRLCLRAALDHVEQVERLVLIGATPGLDDPLERTARREADEALAADLEAGGVDPFLDTWLDLPLFEGLHPAMTFRAERARNTASGLAASLRLAGTGRQEPLWGRLGELARHRVPVLLVTGDLDTRFGAIAADMADRIGPEAEHLVISDAGHSAHLEQPARTTRAVRDWLARTARPADQADRNRPRASRDP